MLNNANGTFVSQAAIQIATGVLGNTAGQATQILERSTLFPVFIGSTGIPALLWLQFGSLGVSNAVEVMESSMAVLMPRVSQPASTRLPCWGVCLRLACRFPYEQGMRWRKGER